MFYVLLVIACLLLQNPLATIVVALLCWHLHKKGEEADKKRYAEMEAKRKAMTEAAKAERDTQIAARKAQHPSISSTRASTSSSAPKQDFEIETGVLTACNVKEETVVVPNYVVSIGERAFKNMSQMKWITIPVGVKSIGKEAFIDCKKLLRADIPSGVHTIGDGAFLRCRYLEEVSLPNGILCIGDSTFLACNNLTSVSMPESLDSIGDQAFYGCINLKNIVVPHSVVNIGQSAFAECAKLERIALPDKITAIKRRVFSGCQRLEDITFPSGIISIDEEAFYKCNAIRSLKLPASLKTIGVRAFAQCNTLRSIDVPDGVTDIEGYAFASCSNLTSISIPNSVTFIGDGAFNGCNELLTIRAPVGSAAERYATRNSIRFVPVVIRNTNEPMIHEIDFADFVVRSNNFFCYFNHNVETIQALVSILLRDGRIQKTQTIAAYCRDCNCYYILDSSFKNLQKRGVLLCQLITLDELKGKGAAIFTGENMKAQSLLRRCGYTVNATDDLSETQRQKILALVLENHLYSASELYNFLDWLIGYHGKSRQRDMSAAVAKWTADRDFVANHKAASRRIVGVNSITYHQ